MYWNAREGKYRLALLPERVEGRKLAEVEIVDMRQEFRETHTQVPVSRRLKQEIEAQLANRQADDDPPEPPRLLLVSAVPQLRPDAALRELFHIADLSPPRASPDLPLLRILGSGAAALPELR